MYLFRKSIALVGFTVLALGCDTSSMSVTEEEAPSQSVQRGSSLTLDEQFVLIAQDVDGFGGLFLDESGGLTMYLTDLANADDAKLVIASKHAGLIGERAAAKYNDIRVLRGRYSFIELHDWKMRSKDVFKLPGAQSYDIDERANRLVIGVTEAAASSAVVGRLKGHGIPDDAVAVRVVEPISNLTKLTDRVRPLKGGLEIDPEFTGECTFGFNARRGSEYGFVTNSHCTKDEGTVHGDEFFQDSDNDSNDLIGEETVDPPFYNPQGPAKTAIPGCSIPCRQSDSAFIRYDSEITNNDIQFGKIARTSSRGPNSGSTTISGLFTITAEPSSHLLGQELNKIGRTTGWTYGDISATCVDYNAPQHYAEWLCQYNVDAGAGGGDSGSPVFGWDGVSDDVTLYGLLWGGLGSQVFIYSPISSINYELGVDAINP